LQLPLPVGKPARYLHLLENPKERYIFTLARCNVLPSNVVYGRFGSLPLETRLCPCNTGTTESLVHMILYCPLYKDMHASHLDPHLARLPGRQDEVILHKLLLGKDKTHTRQIAIFINLIIQRRRPQLLNGPSVLHL
ncbi:hypothetical protein JRQ81_020194, partial [Phrynocephalus forsythii]